MLISKIALYFQWFAMMASSITYLYQKRKIDQIFNLKFIGLYCLIAFTFCSLSILQSLEIISLKQTLRIHRISILLHFSILSTFFLKVIIIKKIRLFLKFSIGIIVPILIFTILAAIKQDKSFYTIVIANICLVVFSITYFIQIFYQTPQYNILNEPNFWITSGIFISMGMSIPNNMMENYLNQYIRDLDFFVFTNIFGKSAYGIMHLFFIKAFLCSPNRN